LSIRNRVSSPSPWRQSLKKRAGYGGWWEGFEEQVGLKPRVKECWGDGGESGEKDDGGLTWER